MAVIGVTVDGLQFDHYGRLAGIEVIDAADSVLPPGLLDDARAPPLSR